MTEFYAFDIDGSGNFVIGAGSSSSDLVASSNTPNAIVLKYTSSGTISWGKQFPT